MAVGLSSFLFLLASGFLLVSHSSGRYVPMAQMSAPCLSNQMYTVVAGDDCGKIAKRKSVARGALIAINDVLPDCSNLRVGQILCLPESCSLLAVNPGDSCLDVALAANITFSDLLTWNPYINSECTNLMAGDQVCISLPGAAPTPTSISTTTTVTQTSGYATATVVPPGAVPHGTTPNCGGYYQVHDGDYCELIAYNFTISIELFQAINPDINDECTNLIPGLFYCVSPTPNWNETTTTTTVSTYTAVPAPTTSGTTSHCYEWHVVQSGDTCARIEHIYGISIEQIALWNPNLLQDCSNLRLGRAYCVHGDTGSSSSRPQMAIAQPTGEADISMDEMMDNIAMIW